MMRRMRHRRKTQKCQHPTRRIPRFGTTSKTTKQQELRKLDKTKRPHETTDSQDQKHQADSSGRLDVRTFICLAHRKQDGSDTSPNANNAGGAYLLSFYNPICALLLSE